MYTAGRIEIFAAAKRPRAEKSPCLCVGRTSLEREDSGKLLKIDKCMVGAFLK